VGEPGTPVITAALANAMLAAGQPPVSRLPIVRAVV
jgi:CO/xanthine dehydrogenase Mo-binding subunit